MTHFTVLVRYEGRIEDAEQKIAQMLAPYDENTEVPAYKERLSKVGVESALKFFSKQDANTPSPSGVSVKKTELTSDEIKEYFGGEGGGKDGRGYFQLRTYNPRSEWDWYQVGGRWRGMLLLKAGAKGVSGGRPLMDLRTEPKNIDKGTDIAYLKDVDFDRMRAEATASVTEEYYKAMDFVLKSLDEGKKFDDLTADLYFQYGIEDESLEERLARRGTFVTHSVVDDKGWHEASKMGWWGVEHDEKEDKATWTAKFTERFLSNPTDKTVIAVVDCHI